MLKQRVVTAILMAAAFLLSAFYLPLEVLAGAFAVIVALGAWEWAPLAGLSRTLGKALFALGILLGTLALYRYGGFSGEWSREQVQPVLGLAGLWWCFALLWVRSFPASADLWRHPLMRLLMGALVLLPSWFAAVFLLHIDRPH